MQSAAERRNRTTETLYVNSKCKVLRNGETHKQTHGHQTHGTDWIGPVIWVVYLYKIFTYV